MAQYTIGEVEQLTGIKPYILRYWEEIIPSFTPQKDLNGRRLYSQRNIDMIRRLKYLIYTERYTIDGARSQIIKETQASDSVAAALAAIRQIRADLNDVYLELNSRGKGGQTESAKAEVV